MKWIFLGEVCIPRQVVFPCGVPLRESKPVSFDESRRMGSILASMVKPAKCVTDSSTIYHALYDSIPTSTGVVPLSEVVSSARSLSGGICELMRAVHVYTIAFVEEKESRKPPVHYSVYPVIVLYKDGIWEHISLAPAKELAGARVKLNDEYGLGIVEVPREVETVRPYAHSVLMNPTTLLLKRKCNLTEGSGGRSGGAG